MYKTVTQECFVNRGSTVYHPFVENKFVCNTMYFKKCQIGYSRVPNKRSAPNKHGDGKNPQN